MQWRRRCSYSHPMLSRTLCVGSCPVGSVLAVPRPSAAFSFPSATDTSMAGLSTVIVEPNFRDCFCIAHPTPRFAALLDALPSAVVASRVSETVPLLAGLRCVAGPYAPPHAAEGRCPAGYPALLHTRAPPPPSPPRRALQLGSSAAG